MATRSGGFGVSLDPFGRGRGGLGRYNVTGETIQSLAEYEAYATAVAWANGQASDEEYLASLQSLVDLANPGTRDRITAENKLSDAIYSIGRNKIAGDVNAADTPAERVAALRRLQAFDEQRLATMDPDNQAYRAQVDRVAGVRVDIRQSQYSELVNKVNAGKATTGQLLSMARTFADASRNDPDNDDWKQTVISLTDRVADEDLADAYQAYQHNRLSGAKLLAKLDARIADLAEGSPQYKELVRQREDLRERISDEERVKRAATMNGKRAAGTTSDSGYLAYLRDEVDNATPGTAQWIEARDRLAEFTFSLAEDKLRFDVQKGRQPVSKLIAFYKSARARMDPNSERYRALTLAIDSLSRGGGSGGGGGGGKAGRGVAYYSKQLVGESTLVDILGGAKEPPGFKDLFRLDITNLASRRWWDNNMRSAVDAFQRGDRTWTYYDKQGGTHELAFTPGLMNEFDRMNLEYTRLGLASADTVKDRQYWVGKIITATKALQTRGGQYTMDVYTKTFGDIERAKESALAGGRWAEYVNLTREQTELARFILGGTLDPSQSTNPYLNQEQRARIDRDLAAISPLQQDAAFPDTYNPNGDIVMQMIDDGRISIQLDEDGRAVGGTLDPNAGYLTQLEDGRVAVKPFDINAAGNSVYDPALDREVPAYTVQNAPAVVRHGGQDIEVWQPIMAGGAALPVYKSTTGTASGYVYTPDPIVRSGRGGVHVMPTIPGPAAGVDPYVAGGTLASLPVNAFTTKEGTTLVRWVSIDGKTWVRYTPGTMPPPRVVLPAEFTYDGTKWQQNGEDVDPSIVLSKAHWWGASESRMTGEAWGIGAPGMTYTMRTAYPTGKVDTRPNWSVLPAKRSGPTQYDTNDPDVIRSYYFEDTAASVAAAQAAAAASVNYTMDRALDRPAGVGPQGPGRSRGGSWASDLVPPDARLSRQPTFRPANRGPIVTEDQFNLGIKPPPAPALRPPLTMNLAPIVSSTQGRAPAALKPVTLPKLPYSGAAGVAAKAASLAAAQKKAAETAAAKAAATKAATTSLTYHAPGRGPTESD